MEFRVLGPIRATVADTDVPLGGPRQRRLLAALLLGDGHVVSVDRLVTAVWGDQQEPPAGAPRTVLSYVSRLRSALGNDWVSTRGNGYVLSGDGAFIDAARFERLVSAARNAPLGQVLPLLDEALALWDGRPFDDFADEDWCRPAAVRLEELRLVALEARGQARLDLGELAEAVPELEQLVVEHPLRESFRALLMLALFRSGRQATALRSFQEYRQLLGDETGLEPSRELVDLERRIAVADRSLEFASEGRTKRGYVLTSVLGEGSFGTVYRAVQPSVGREVAVKVVHSELADDPDYVRRFDGEAQLVARLEHPHIVPLYDYWREPGGGAYLVMRYVRGGNLAAAMRTTPRWPLPRVARLLEEIGAALALAHEAGVVHGDVTPANVLFDETANAYLTDFGIATESTLASGSPRRRSDASWTYASPELAGDGRVTARSDQYALAAVAWELLTGGPRDAPPSGALPGEVDRVLHRALAEDPDDRFASMAELLACWRDAVAGLAGAATWPVSGEQVVNPYKGLRPFDEADTNDFFGREASVDRLVALVHQRRFTFVVGPSGSGKSSLVRSGLVPRLRTEGWVATVAVPGAHPVDEIADALLKVAVTAPVGLRERLVDPAGLADSIDSMLADDASQLLLVLDQMEELWTLAEPAVRDRLLDTLAAAATAAGARLRIVATVRADFFDRPLAHPATGPLVEGASYSLAPLTPAELEQAMTAPAARVGVRIEPALAAELMAAVSSQPAGLPLLQYTLTELFERRDGTTMTLSAYEAMGGLRGALVSRAEATHDELPERERPAVRRLFRRLVTPGDGGEDTRRRARLSELAGVPPKLVDDYGAARLLTFDVDPVNREPTVEVAHEALIRHWPRLQAWVEEDREGMRVHRHLAVAAAAWAAQGRDAAELYRGARLQAAMEWATRNPEDLTPTEASFLTQSRHRARSTHRRSVAAIAALATLTVVALVAAGLALAQQNRADESAEEASSNAAVADANAAVAEQRAAEAAEAAAGEARARTDADLRRLAFEAQATAVSQPDLAMLLAVEAYRREPGPASEGALYSALTTQPAVRRFIDVALPLDKAVRSISVSAAGLVALELDGTVALHDASTWRPTGVTIATNGRSSVAFSPSGDELATSTPTGEVRRWDPRTGLEVVSPLRVRPTLTSAVGPPVGYLPDGSLVVVDGAVVGIVPPGGEALVRQVDIPGASQVATLSVSPSGRTIAVSWPAGATGDAGALGLLDAGSLTLRAVPWTMGVPVVHRFAGEGRLVVSVPRGDLSGRVALVDVDAASLTGPVLDVASAAVDLVLLDDGSALASLASGGLLRVRPDMTAGARIELRGYIRMAGLPDGRIVAMSSGRLVEIDPYERSAIGSEVRAGARRAVGLLTGVEGRLLLQGPDSAMVVVDSATLAPVSPRLVTTAGFASTLPVSMSPDGAKVAISNPAGVEVIDVALGRAPRPPFPIGSSDVAAFSPDGRDLLIPGIDGKLHRIDATTGAERWARDFGGELVAAAAWSGDGRLVTARTLSGDARILDADTGDEVGGPLVGVANLMFSPSGATAVTAGAELRILDARSREVVRTFPGTGGFFVAVFVRDGQWISAMTGSGLVELFDIESGARIGVPLRVARDAISDLNRSVIVSDGLYWGAPNGPLVFYDLDPDSWETIACDAAGRNLTRQEWDHYLGSLGEYASTCRQYPASS